MQAALFNVPVKKLLQARLIDGQNAVLHGFNFFFINVNTDHFISGFCKACSGY